MKRFLTFVLWAALSPLVLADDIVQVLERSQQLRLASWPLAAAESPRVQRLKAVFDELAGPLRLEPAPELRVVTGNVVAETLQGRIVIVNEMLGELTHPQLVFLLGHELGHVAGHHWSEMVAVYRQYVPGEVIQAKTDAVAAELGRAASAVSYRQEMQADSHGLKLLIDHGYTRDDAVAFLMGRGLYFDTATHPGTRKRLAHLREQDRTDVGAVGENQQP